MNQPLVLRFCFGKIPKEHLLLLKVEEQHLTNNKSGSSLYDGVTVSVVFYGFTTSLTLH